MSIRSIGRFESREAMTIACKGIGKDAFVVFLCAAVIGLSYLAIGRKASAISSSYFVPATRHKNPDELDDILAKASMPNKTVIITAVNGAWMEQDGMVDLFLRSFRIGEGTQGLLNSLLLVALDGKAFSRCKEIHPHCYNLTTEGIDFSDEKVFMSKDYLKMMWRRILFLKNVLERGYSFVFSDADIMWFRNPLQRFSEDSDFEIACDRYNGNPRDPANESNGGFNFVRSNKRTIDLYNLWYASRNSYPGKHDQDVLNKIKFSSDFSRIGLKLVFLDTKYFSGFCQPRGKLEVICTMHANCCKGLKAKLADLNATLEDWARFRSLNGTNSTAITERRNVNWRAPNACLHSW